MPTCSRCRRSLWFWEASLLGGPCARCGREQVAAREEAARMRLAERRLAFERSGPVHRTWLGASRGALFGALGLVAVGASLLALTGEPGARYPFPKLSLLWALISLGAVAVAVIVGWWQSSWWAGIGCLIGVGAVGGGIVGAYQGLRRRWEVFA